MTWFTQNCGKKQLCIELNVLILAWLYSALFSLMISAACGCAVDALMISAACGSPERAFAIAVKNKKYDKFDSHSARVVATKENSTCSLWLKRVV